MKTRSYTYVLPMLGLSPAYYAGHLENVFYGDTSKPELDEHIFLLFKFNGERKRPSHTSYLWIEEDLKKHPIYTAMYDPDPTHVMMVFDVPSICLRDYSLFKQGLYSKMSDVYKASILEFHYNDSITRQASTVRKVLYRDESLYKDWENRLGMSIQRDQEISSVPNEKEEMYDESMNIKRGLEPSKYADDTAASN